MTYRCCPLPFQPDALLRYGQQLGLTALEESLHSVAQAVAVHPLWQEVPQAIGIVRAQPQPVLAILGTFSAKALGQIQLQSPFLNQACERLRYVSYAAAIATCEQLAAQLKDTFGAKFLREFQFYGVPRGGPIVLGMLSYILGLRAEQLNAPYASDAPLVVVDDCALSGSQFYRVLQQYPQHTLIFATLYAHPTLRQTIVDREPRVLRCLSGQDLYDHGPDAMGIDYAAWQRQNQALLAGHRYWLGLPDYICFPWNEPDHLLWNPVTASLEKSWHILPPQACLKNRPSEGPSLPIQIQPTVRGWLQTSEHIVFGELGGQVLMGDLSTGETFGLSGKAAAFWRVILGAAGMDEAIAQLAQQYPARNLHAELAELIEQLIDQRILHEPV
jgi:Coenzyme PQQ synthesis protein D (PqqD)